MAKRILIIGRGQIGRGLIAGLTGHQIEDWHGDIDNVSGDVLHTLRPDVVINAAGKTDLAWCEANAREAVRCNLEAPVRLYDRILRYGELEGRDIRYLHFSSGCIWDGPYREDGKPFEPYDPPSPACLYSWTKAACDALLLDRDPKQVAILRPRQIYSADQTLRNSITKLLRYPNLIDSPNSMSSLEIIVRTVRALLDSESDWTGIWSIYDLGVVTPYDVGVMLSEAGLREQPKRISKTELDVWHVPRRVDTVLYDPRFEEIMEPEPIREVLRRTIEAYGKRQTG